MKIAVLVSIARQIEGEYVFILVVKLLSSGFEKFFIGFLGSGGGTAAADDKDDEAVRDTPT